MTGYKIFSGCDLASEYEYQKKKNMFTWRALMDGYTHDHPPEGSQWSDIYKRFEWTYQRRNSSMWETPCGLSVRGINVMGGVGWLGEDWDMENDNPIINCPFWSEVCDCRDKRIESFYKRYGISRHASVSCACHEVAEYRFDCSAEKINAEITATNEAEKRKYLTEHPKVCPNMLHWDRITGEPSVVYWYDECVSYCNSTECVMFGEKFSGKKGNVYYDVRITQSNPNITLVNNSDTVKTVIKGKRLFKKPTRIELCERIVRLNYDDILQKEKGSRYMRESFFDPNFEVEIENVRAEVRESRDLMADMEDIKSGATVIHESDRIEAAKHQKREKALNAADKRKSKLVQKLAEGSADHITEYRYGKLVNRGLATYAEVRQAKNRIEAEKKKASTAPQQISFFKEMEI